MSANFAVPAPFNPPRRTLMGPGPSDVYPSVLQALAKPTIGHLDPLFIQMMDELKSMLQQVLRTDNAMTSAISAPGSAGMEACFSNLVEPGDTVLVCVNGVFGTRMLENVERCGGNAVVVNDDWGKAVDPQKVEDALKQNPNVRIVAFVHAETSTGARSDAKTLCALAKQHNCLSIVDTVTSLGGIELLVDDWGIDALYSGSQKCLSCVPGLSPVSFSAAAVDKIQSRTSKVQSWFLDQTLLMAYWAGDGKRSYHHTAPVNALYGLHEALRLLCEEGLENAWQRHTERHLELRAGLEAMGLQFVVEESSRLPQLNTVYIPDGVDDAQVRSTLLNEYNLEIGAGLGEFAGKAWRIGLMGYSANRANIALCLKALSEALA